MFTFRIYTFRDGSFWKDPSYVVARNSKHVRRIIEKNAGPEVARKSCVTAIAPYPIDAGVAAA